MELNSEIILCKNIKVDKEYNNVLSFSESDMVNLCRTNKVVSASNYSFIRANGTIQTKFNYNTVLECTYMAFQNKDYSNKWFFAWIDDVIFKGDNNTEIKYTIDVWSTWFSKLNFAKSFVVREHVNDDTEGLHTIPENLETGEYKVNAHLRDIYNRQEPTQAGLSKYFVVVASTVDLYNDNNVYTGIYDGIPTGVKYFKFGIDYSDPEFPPLENLANVLYRLASTNKLDAIQQMFIVPYWLAKDLPDYSISPKEVFTSITPNKNLDGYVPVNKKCLTFPYCYILLSNLQGQSAILRQEFWDKLSQNTTAPDGTQLPAGDMVLQIWGAITPRMFYSSYSRKLQWR